MQILRFFTLGALVSVVILALIGFLILPDEYDIEVAVPMQAEAETIYEELVHLKGWQEWAFIINEPGMKTEYLGAETGVGAIYTWQGEGTDGRLEIVETQPYQTVKLKALMQEGQFESEIMLRIAKTENGSLVSWEEHGSFGWNILTRFTASLLDFEGRMATNYENGLQLLKEQVEAR